GSKRVGRVARPWNEDPANSDVHDAALRVRRVPLCEMVAAQRPVHRPKWAGKEQDDGAAAGGGAAAAGWVDVAAVRDERSALMLVSSGAGPLHAGVHFGAHVAEHAWIDIEACRDQRMVALAEWRRDVAIERAEAPRFATGAGGDPVLVHMVQQATL